MLRLLDVAHRCKITSHMEGGGLHDDKRGRRRGRCKQQGGSGQYWSSKLASFRLSARKASVVSVHNERKLVSRIASQGRSDPPTCPSCDNPYGAAIQRRCKNLLRSCGRCLAGESPAWSIIQHWLWPPYRPATSMDVAGDPAWWIRPVEIGPPRYSFDTGSWRR